MSEAEFIESINLHTANTIDSYSVFITLVFAYLTAAYFVGARLTKIQAAIVTLAFIGPGAGFLLTTITHAQSFAALVAKYPQFVSSPGWLLPWPIMVLVTQCFGIIISLYFMFDIRRHGTHGYG